MAKVIVIVGLFLVGCSLVQGQSASVNITLGDIESLKKAALTSISRPFNALRDDVYGHFFRSQGTLRVARQAIFSTASVFPYYLLTEDTRNLLMANMTKLLTECADPTIDYLQKDSMLRFYNFMTDATTPIEKALQPAIDQLNTLEEDLKAATDQSCLAKVRIAQRQIQTAYNSFIDAVNDCTRQASQAYRQPINEFTRVHFIALPLMNKINRELSACNSNNVKDSCVLNFLSKLCAEDTCKVCSTITAVKTQAETMVNEVQDKFDSCVEKATAKVPKDIPYDEAVKACS